MFESHALHKKPWKKDQKKSERYQPTAQTLKISNCWWQQAAGYSVVYPSVSAVYERLSAHSILFSAGRLDGRRERCESTEWKDNGPFLANTKRFWYHCLNLRIQSFLPQTTRLSDGNFIENKIKLCESEDKWLTVPFKVLTLPAGCSHLDFSHVNNSSQK